MSNEKEAFDWESVRLIKSMQRSYDRGRELMQEEATRDDLIAMCAVIVSVVSVLGFMIFKLIN